MKEQHVTVSTMHSVSLEFCYFDTLGNSHIEPWAHNLQKNNNENDDDDDDNNTIIYS